MVLVRRSLARWSRRSLIEGLSLGTDHPHTHISPEQHRHHAAGTQGNRLWCFATSATNGSATVAVTVDTGKGARVGSRRVNPPSDLP